MRGLRKLWALPALTVALCLASGAVAQASTAHLDPILGVPDAVVPGGQFVVELEVLNDGETGIAPGGTLQIVYRTTGPIALTSAPPEFHTSGSNYPVSEQHCQSSPSEVSCILTFGEGLPPGVGVAYFAFTFLASVEPLTSGSASLTVEAISDGFPPAKVARAITIGPEPYGIASWSGGLFDSEGTLVRQGAATPAHFDNDLRPISEASSVEGYFHVTAPKEQLRNVITHLPVGLVGNVLAVPRCTLTELKAFACPGDSQVGLYKGTFWGIPQIIPVYDMYPPVGAPAEFAFNFFGVIVPFVAKLRQSDYGIDVENLNVNSTLVISDAFLEFWGVPGDHSHDGLRGKCAEVGTGERPGGSGESCPAAAPRTSFLRTPTSCTGEPLAVGVEYDTYEHPGVEHAASYQLPPQTGCERIPFGPTFSALATAHEAETPSGLEARLDMPNPSLTNPDGISESDIKSVKVALPVGMTINPSQAEGLGVCTPAQFASTALSFRPDASNGCPSDSKIGTAEIKTPLLEKAIFGNLFIARPYDNPFKSLLAIYLVLEDPERGMLIKQAGKIDLDPVTGQITTTFDNIPQLPFSTFIFKFREGARAPLVTPPTCGSYTTTTQFVPWSDPSRTVQALSHFETTSGIGGGACPAHGVPPFAPQVVSGTVNNAAGSNSPFDLRISRRDGEQEITKFTAVFPPGLTGDLTGVPFCSDAAIEAARHKTGQEELAAPSCPAASEIGHSVVGAGVGSVLAHTPGKIYLAGPYHGSALSIVSITSATVGPFDLGTVVIRFALRINPTTAQVEIDSSGSDPIPHIIDGIIVHVREIRVYIDREKFIRNPTNCDPMEIRDTITGAGADARNVADQNAVDVATRFQAANCSSLGFKPAFQVATSANTSRTDGASLHVRLTYPHAADGTQANIREVRVELPKQLPSRLTTLQKACTEQQFAADAAACPDGSIIGMARAVTPIIPVPLAGPAYFVSRGGTKFPELIIVLQGYGVTIELHGETFISKAGITSATFKTVPDQLVESFELTLPQGPNSVLAANGDLCASKLMMPTSFTAQNGATIQQDTAIAVEGCEPELRVIRHSVSGKSATIVVSVPSAGTLIASGGGVIRESRAIRKAGKVTLRLRLSKTEQRFVAHHHDRRLRVPIKLSFRPGRGKNLHATVAVLMR